MALCHPCSSRVRFVDVIDLDDDLDPDASRTRQESRAEVVSWGQLRVVLYSDRHGTGVQRHVAV